MDATNYTRNTNLSEIEWLIIQKFRSLISNKFGTFIIAKVRDGKVADLEGEIDIRVCLSEDKTKLREIQH